MYIYFLNFTAEEFKAFNRFSVEPSFDEIGCNVNTRIQKNVLQIL